MAYPFYKLCVNCCWLKVLQTIPILWESFLLFFNFPHKNQLPQLFLQGYLFRRVSFSKNWYFSWCPFLNLGFFCLSLTIFLYIFCFFPLLLLCLFFLLLRYMEDWDHSYILRSFALLRDDLRYYPEFVHKLILWGYQKCSKWMIHSMKQLVFHYPPGSNNNPKSSSNNSISGSTWWHK